MVLPKVQSPNSRCRTCTTLVCHDFEISDSGLRAFVGEARRTEVTILVGFRYAGGENESAHRVIAGNLQRRTRRYLIRRRRSVASAGAGLLLGCAGFIGSLGGCSMQHSNHPLAQQFEADVPEAFQVQIATADTTTVSWKPSKLGRTDTFVLERTSIQEPRSSVTLPGRTTAISFARTCPDAPKDPRFGDFFSLLRTREHHLLLSACIDRGKCSPPLALQIPAVSEPCSDNRNR